MGNSAAWRPVDAVARDGTTLAEVQVYHVRDAHNVAGMQPDTFTPVVLVPNASASSCCFVPMCWVSVPSGFAAIVSRFGADVPGQEADGTWSPGFHCFWPWYSINRLVSRQLIIFDTPVKDCKTKDNITVNIDVLIVLEVVAADTFVYGLGPEKLDSLLRASQDEVIRQVVFEIPVETIYDLHGHNTEGWVKTMNKNFEPFGVVVHHFTIRNVQLPTDMAKDMEDKTLYESKTLEKRMQQESDKFNLNNEEARQKLKEECENARMAAEEQAVTTKAQIVKEVREVIASTEKDMAVLEAARHAEVADLIQANELEVNMKKAEIMTMKRENEAHIAKQVGTIEATAEAYEAEKKASGRMLATEKISLGKTKVAQAEGAAITAFAARRQQEQDMARLDILAKLAGNGNIQIATTLENNMGLAPDNSLVSQMAQQGLEAFRMKLAEMTGASVKSLEMGQTFTGGLVRPVPQTMNGTGRA